jgi:L-asparaginase
MGGARSLFTVHRSRNCLNMIHLLFTGGTISMQRDQAAGGNVPTHGGEALVGFANGIERISPYRIENWAMLPACHLGPDRLWALRERVKEIAQTGEVKGIVVTHGTDTLEETAYLLDRTLDPKVPVAITGAMRTSSDEAWDGPRNLLDAAAVAASDQSAGRGTMVVFHGKVLAGMTAVKTHATDPDAFATPHSAPIGRVEKGHVVYEAEQRGSGAAGRSGRADPSALSARVALVPMVVGDDGRMLDLARSDHDGLVIIAFGSGNLPPGAVPAISRWIQEGKSVVLASRCPAGVVTPLYAFEGGGARLAAMGVTPAGPRTPSQAWMELMIALSAGAEYGS